MILAPEFDFAKNFDWHSWPELLGQHNLAVAAMVVLFCAAIPALFFCVNIWLFRRPWRGWNKRLLPSISVLIPARNEEQSIGITLKAVLASRGVDLEVIVLNDGSTDRTAEIVKAVAEKDPRVRLETALPLPEGWNGKQHACWVLASKARNDVFLFLDADVRVASEAIYRMVSELNYLHKDEQERAMVSGFPRQSVGTFLDRLLLPLIDFVLLGFFPLAGERRSSRSLFAAGCGQFMMMRREPYFETDGHSAYPRTMHEGLLMPKLFRRHGFRTSVYDLSRDAVCRANTSAGEVWRDLAKNATEGIASPRRILILTPFLFLGQVLPLPLAILSYCQQHSKPLQVAVVAMMLGYAMRLIAAWRYKQSWRGALLHPLGVLVLLLLQWYAFFRKLFRLPVYWKGREYRAG